MTVERERERHRERAGPAADAGPKLEPVVDASALARNAAASADGIEAEPAGIEIAIRTTTSRSGEVMRIVATPDTTVSEIMSEASSGLEVEDPGRYLLVANGEVLADGDRPIGDLLDQKDPANLEMRLVRRPEAGVTRVGVAADDASSMGLAAG